ncbi:high-potential iron-sulfur protein [Persicitalea sp.]|uniref:high-potential iron-sulfur protein n=1 Tax=Persicitalea sp. TaxID=3100273 RepID=UPI00359351A8
MIERRKRREFLRMMVVTPVGGYLAASCKGSKKSVVAVKDAKKASPCDDLTGVPAVDIEKRKSLGYTNLSPIPDSMCSNCQLFIPQKEGAECGGCLLFAGPVSPEGYCTYWAPVV